MTVYFGHNVIS